MSKKHKTKKRTPSGAIFAAAEPMTATETAKMSCTHAAVEAVPAKTDVSAVVAEAVNDVTSEPVTAESSPAKTDVQTELESEPASEEVSAANGDPVASDQPAGLDIPEFASTKAAQASNADANAESETAPASDDGDMLAEVSDHRLKKDDKKQNDHARGAIIGAIVGLIIVIVLAMFSSCSQKYAVIYDDGTGKPYEVYYRMGTQIDVSTLKKPTRTGYTFEGWYLDPELKSPATTIDQSGEITLYAKWNPKEYTILYDGMPGGATVADQDTYLYGEKKVLPSYEKENYDFVGWSINGSDFPVMELSGTETGTLKATAVYEPKTWTITYVSDGITPDAQMTYQYGDAFSFAPSVMDGAVFEGWYSDVACTQPVTGVSADTTGDLTVYAKFSSTAASAAMPTPYDYTADVDGKAAAVKRDYGVNVVVDRHDAQANTALDALYSALGNYTTNACKKIGTVRITNSDSVNGSDINVNADSTSLIKDINADIFRVLCDDKTDAFKDGWTDYTSFISDRAASGSVLDDAAETWGYHMAGVYGDDQVAAKFGILYNAYGSYLK